jgi:hypothetical protein
MRGHYKAITVALLAAVGVAESGCAAGLWDNFNYSIGTNLNQLVAQGWGSSDAGALVTNNVYGKTGPDYVAAIADANAAINTANSNQTGKVWTECLVNGATRMDPATLPTNQQGTVMVAVTTNGYAVVYNPALGGWDVCTNDARGQTIDAGVASGVWARVSILQDFTAHTASLFLDGRLVRQNLRFIANRDSSLKFTARAGGPDTSYLDDVYSSNAVPASLLGPVTSTNDINGDGTPDAQELASYGAIAARVPGDYPSLTVALASNPATGRIFVVPGGYAETLVISNATTLIGSVLTNLTSLTVTTGQVATLSGITNFTCVDVTVRTNATLSLGSGTAVVSTLTIQHGATVHVTNATLMVDGVMLTGTFTLDSGWNGGLTIQSLNYTNDFESYGLGQPLSRCGAQGWGASSAGSVIEGTNVHVGGAKAALVADGTMVSNTVDGTGGKVWTDFYFNDAATRSAVGPYPVVDTAKAGIMFVNSNNFVTIWNQGAWDVCFNDFLRVDRSAALAAPAGQWYRLTVCQDFGNTNMAVFVNGILVRQQVPFISAAVSGYHHMTVQAGDGAVCLDDVKIWTHMPPGLTNGANSDLDDDGSPDAVEIQNYGTTTLWPQGSLFKIR